MAASLDGWLLLHQPGTVRSFKTAGPARCRHSICRELTPALRNYCPPTFFCSAQTLRFRLNLFKLKEGRDMPPKMFGHLVSNILYEKR